MVNVSCHSSTVLRQKPQTNSCHPPISHSTTPSVTGGTRWYLFSQRSSGNFAKSRGSNTSPTSQSLPAQLGKLCEVGDVFDPRVVVFIGNDPAYVRPEKPEKRRRMQIQFLVGMPVMVAVMRRPPKHALLRRGHGHESNHELEHATSFERAVRKIAVIARRDEEHPHDQQAETCHQVIPMKRHEEN